MCIYLTTKYKQINLADIQGLLEILRTCGRTLVNLDIGGTKLTGDSVALFQGSLPDLQKLDCYHCYTLTDAVLLNLLAVCGKGLKSLNIAYCPAITENCKQQIQLQFKDLKILGI